MTSSAEHPVLIGVEDNIATLTLNRPAKLNALNYATIDGIQRHLDAIERDDAIRIVILTGAGDKAFSAGADIAGFSSSVAAGVTTAMREFVGRGQALTKRVENFPKPIIAAVNGIAFGGGCEVVEACPLAIASEHARFAKPEINLGFPPPFGGHAAPSASHRQKTRIAADPDRRLDLGRGSGTYRAHQRSRTRFPAAGANQGARCDDHRKVVGRGQRLSGECHPRYQSFH